MSTTGRQSRESQANAAPAAAQGRRPRAYTEPPSPPNTNSERSSWFLPSTDSGTTSSTEVVSADFVEAQRKGLAAIICLASDEVPSGPRATETRSSRPHFAAPRQVSNTVRPNSDTKASRVAEQHSRTVAEPTNSYQVTSSATIVQGRPIAGAPPVQIPFDDSTDTRATTYGNKNTIAKNQTFWYLQRLSLIVILTFQAILSLRLIWSNTTFLDEAIYLSAGHIEIAHWLHGTAVPAYATYFSGAPVIYPPLGAIADSMGGLAAARLLSLLFMLSTTCLLWNLTSRLYGRRAAMCAAALFAVLGPTQRLGAFATFDAMALFLLALAAWCIVFARDRADSSFSLLAGTVLLALANATKYSTMLFDPSVIALAGLTVAQRRGVKAAVARSGYVAAGTIALISVLLTVGGPWYLAGLLYTTVSRSFGTSPAQLVLTDSWRWIGVVWVVAVAGVLIGVLRRSGSIEILILVVFAASIMFAPFNQARIHTTTSLSKHVDFGAWFAAVAAGYAISRLTEVTQKKFIQLAMSTLILIGISWPVSLMGRAQASEIFHEWPNSTGLIAELRFLTRHYTGPYLAEDYDIPVYYMTNSVPWQRWYGTWYFRYTPPGSDKPLTGQAAYYAAIKHHFFSLIILNFSDTEKTDTQLTIDMQQTGNYRVVDVVPSSVGQYTIWAYQPLQSAASSHDHD